MSSLLKLLLCMVSLLHGKREILISKKEGGDTHTIADLA